MAITRAQQAKQLLKEGGRTGFFTAGLAAGDNISPGTSSKQGGDGPSRRDDGPSRSRIQDEKQQEFVKNQIKDLVDKQQEEKAFEPFETLMVKNNNFPGFIGMGLNALKGPRQFMLNKNIDYFRGLKSRGRLDDPRYSANAQGYKNYMSDRLAGNIDAAGNIINQDDDDNSIIPLMAQAPSNTDQETEVEEEPFQRNFRLMADGGRAEFAEGGIMPRLSDLSGNVSSAEQMLQEINQRLQSAESTLGEGGGMAGATNNQFNVDPMSGPLKPALPSNFKPATSVAPGTQPQLSIENDGLASIANYTPFGGETVGIPEQFKSGFDEYKKENPIGIGGQAISYSMLPDGNRVSFGDTANAAGFSNYLKSIGAMPDNPFGPRPVAIQSPLKQLQSAGGPMQSPLQTALGLADGGRAALAEGGMPYEGGIMDLESGRQQYFLGKLVKKATRAVKKIAKSPIGKAALLYAGGSYLSGMGAFGGLKGAGSLSGLFGPKGAGKFLFSPVQGSGSIFSKIPGGKFGAGILGSTALSYFMTPEEEEQQAMNYGADIDDPRTIMANPSLYTNRRLAAEGGSMDEPVAKKTMPLLDMDGQEMDLRAEGGFVPIGRMEKADDVPARLSKNEFVFTAEAVRNAGEGDVDKGAEVMYNMMKNLESGGEVSEESQGLEGAREMFQTSQRLEEVI